MLLRPMKQRDSTLIFWSASALLCVVISEGVLVDLAMRTTRLHGQALAWLWIFPTFVFPVAIVGGMIGWHRSKSRSQRILTLKYLIAYLPWVVVPIVVQEFGDL